MTSYVELCELAEADDILMIDAPLQKCPSMAINDCGDCTVIIDHDQIAGVTDLLTVLAHELGHCETMSFYTEHSLELRERMEYRANKWAIKKLAPKDEMITAMKDGNTEIWQLAEYFGVTRPALSKEINKLVDSGFIRISRNKVKILNKQALISML